MPILVTRSSMPDFDEYMAEIEPLWESAWLTNMGVKHRALEAQLKEYLGVSNLSLLVNGHLALELTLQAFHLRGEVITTPFTFASTTHAIVRNGLKPVFCDIKESDFTIDPDLIESLITPDTTAIVPVHVYGNICDVKRIQDIANKHGLRVIYDAAHAFGEKQDGVGIANFGDASIFSFHATKVFNTIEGGAAIFQDEAIGKRLYNLKNFGIQSEEVVDAVGANAKMNEFCAAMGICNLRHVDGEIKKREAVVKQYRARLGNVPGIRVKEAQAGVQDNYAYFPIIVDEKIYPKSRNEIYTELKEHDIFSRKYFYPLTCDFDCYRGVYPRDNLHIARKISRRVLTLPLAADLPLEMVDRICDIYTERMKPEMKYCHRPFDFLYLDHFNGDAYLCPWMEPNKSCIGNILNESIDEVWNGERAEYFRAQIKKGDYSICRKVACPHLQNDDLPDEPESSTAWEKKSSPLTINMAFDFVCNQSCPTCRNEVFVPDTDYQEKVNNIVKKSDSFCK